MTALQLNNLILTELKELRSEFNEHAKDTVQRLSKLETQVASIVGDMQPGRMTLAEKSIKDLQQWKWRITGIATCAAAFVSAGVTVLFHFWR